jgi:hypothetical protein
MTFFGGAARYAPVSVAFGVARLPLDEFQEVMTK